MTATPFMRIASVGVLGLTVALAGCSSATTGQDASVASAPDVGAPVDSQGGAVAADGRTSLSGGDAVLRGESARAPSSASITVIDRKIIRNGNASIEVLDIQVAAGKLRALATGLQGVVSSESISSGKEPPIPIPLNEGVDGTVSTPPVEPGTAFVVLSIPATQLDAAMAGLASIGTVTTRSLASQEVTGEYVDAQARVTSMRASVARIRALIAKATSIRDLVALESELSERQSELDAVQARLDSLKDQVATSTLTVMLSTPRVAVEEDESGFLAGLNAGLTALGAAFVVGLTILGALMPFLILLGILAIPFVIWTRRRRSAPSAPAAPPAPEPSGDPDLEPVGTSAAEKH